MAVDRCSASCAHPIDGSVPSSNFWAGRRLVASLHSPCGRPREVASTARFACSRVRLHRRTGSSVNHGSRRARAEARARPDARDHRARRRPTSGWLALLDASLDASRAHRRALCRRTNLCTPRAHRVAGAAFRRWPGRFGLPGARGSSPPASCHRRSAAVRGVEGQVCAAALWRPQRLRRGAQTPSSSHASRTTMGNR